VENEHLNTVGLFTAVVPSWPPELDLHFSSNL
jgi:hypothetical protein